MSRVKDQPGRLRADLASMQTMLGEAIPHLAAVESLASHNRLTDVVVVVDDEEGTIDCSMQLACAIGAIIAVYGAVKQLCRTMDVDEDDHESMISNPAGTEPPDTAA